MRKVPTELQQPLSVIRFVREAVVRGRPADGRRPRVNLLYGDYRGDVISRSGAYSGKTLTLIGNPDACRQVKAYLKGECIDTLHVRPPWAMREHSVETRVRAAKELRRLSINFQKLHDAVGHYDSLVRARGANNPKSNHVAKEVARLEQEAPSTTPSHVPSVGPTTPRERIRIKPGRRALNN